MQHGRAEDGGEVVQRHLVLAVEGGHPHQVLDKEDDAGLAWVLGKLGEEVEVGSGLLFRVLDCVRFKKFRVRLTCEYAFRQVSEKYMTKLACCNAMNNVYLRYCLRIPATAWMSHSLSNCSASYGLLSKARFSRPMSTAEPFTR